MLAAKPKGEASPSLDTASESICESLPRRSFQIREIREARHSTELERSGTRRARHSLSKHNFLENAAGLVNMERRDDPRIQRVLLEVQRDPTRRVRELAHCAGMSVSYLEHLFKHQTGGSVHTLLKNRRLDVAAHLLQGTNMSIKQISYAAGYRHAPSFARAFRLRFLQTPREHRLVARQSSITDNSR